MAFLKGLAAWGPLTVAAALAPHLDQLVSFPLISDYWQPNLDRTAALVASFASIVTYALGCRTTLLRIRRVVKFFVVVFGVAFLTCIFLQIHDVSAHLSGRFLKDIVVYVHVVVYVGMFVSFAVVLVGGYFLTPARKDKPSRLLKKSI